MLIKVKFKKINAKKNKYITKSTQISLHNITYVN